MKQRIVVLLALTTLALTTLALTACTNKELKEIENDTLVYYPSTFEKDNKTTSKIETEIIKTEKEQEKQLDESQEQEENKLDYGTPEYNTSEIQLDNNDESINYEIVEDNIVYRGITFIDLYKIVNSVEQPYELNTFINFLIKTYDSHGETVVYTSLQTDSEGEVGVDIGSAITISESLYDREGYTEIVEKYNGDEAVWSICLYTYGGENEHNVYGCKSYVAYNGSSDLVVDMQEFNVD